MKHLKNFFELNESQSKKIKDVLTFSVVLDWYNDNKDKIANIIGCKPDELATEEELIKQSRGLVKSVINIQSAGDSGNRDNEIAGFSSFSSLDKYLLHDILHNIYDVSIKDFDKSLSDIEFTESEIFEEIEVLCIEESFMKFCNILYLKTDFINQNINQLASFLMMAILKNDPTRIKNILDGKEPYLEIYGVKYELKEGNPYQNFFLSLKGNFRDMPIIRNSENFKNYMIKLINVGKGIDATGGDRSQYPDNNFYGDKEYPSYSEITSIIDDLISDKNRLTIISTTDVYRVDDLKKMGITLSYDDEYNESIDFEDLSELKLPFQKEFFLENNLDIDFEGWFEYLSELSDKEFYEFKDVKYLVFKKSNDSYCLIDNDSFDEMIIDKWYTNGMYVYDSNHEFIDFEKHKKMSFEEVSKILFENDDSISIMRRNFRDNDIIVNNTKLGSLSKTKYDEWQQDEIKVSKYYTDFSSDRKNKVSISKNVITDNGKKLLSVLNNIRGYTIKNYKELKNKYKNKFTKIDIATYQSLDFNILSGINNNNLGYNVKFDLTENQIKLTKDYPTYLRFIWFNTIDRIISLISKINTKEDLSILKSYIIQKSMPIGVEETVSFYKNLENGLINNKENIKKLIEFDKEITKVKEITTDENFKLFQSKSNYKINDELNILKQDIEYLINKYYGEYDIQIKVPKHFVSYRNTLDDIHLEIKNPPL